MGKDYSKLKNEYKELKEKIEQNKLKKEALKNNEIIKLYHSLIDDINYDKKELDRIKYRLETKKMEDCKHLFVGYHKCFGEYEDNYKMKTNYYCVKCGLSNCYNNYEYPENLSYIECAMPRIYNDTKENNIGIINYGLCDRAEAIYIYDGIIKNHDNISDVDLLKYFKAAIYNRNKKKSKMLKK